MASELSITNLTHGDVLTYPLVVIRGETTAKKQFVHISATPSTDNPEPQKTPYPVRNKLFTALFELQPGSNQVTIATTSSATPRTSQTTTITLVYHQPPPIPPFVRLVYLLPADGDPPFQTPDPVPCGIAAATARVHTAGMMIQTACAEMMHAQGMQRRTFRLSPNVHVIRMQNMTLAEALSKSGMELWSDIARELNRLPHRQNTIDLVVMSFTRMIDGKVHGHTALGGGPLALFGGGSLFTWPESVADIPIKLADSRKFSTRLYFDDSAHRAARFGRRACTSTTIGALLHELGHCLSLPHPTGDAARNGGGIMARGFDDFDRLFVQPEPGKDLPFWDRGSAVRLQHHRYLKFEGEIALRRMRNLTVSAAPVPTPHPVPDLGRGPKFRKQNDGTVVCDSNVGLGHVGYYKNGDNASHEEFGDSQPRQFVVPVLSELLRKCRGSVSDNISLSAIDIDGHITTTKYTDL